MLKYARLLLLLLLIGGASLSAQSWTRVQSLKPGVRVSILDSGGEKHKGTLAAVTADAISIRTGKGEVAIERTRVRRVEMTSGERRLRNALIGAGIGAAVGLVTDQTLGAYIRNEYNEGSGARALTYVAPIALFGGIAATRGTQTLYKAR